MAKPLVRFLSKGSFYIHLSQNAQIDDIVHRRYLHGRL
jgi:hypothetical protein